MNNFEGVQKGGRTFKPQGSGGDDVVIDRVAAGGYEPVHYFEVKKADQPVEPTTPYGRTDGAGESELGLAGSVDHPDASGQAQYLAGKIRRAYRQIVSDGAELENLSPEQRLALRNQLVSAVLDGGNQEPNDAYSAYSARGYVVQVASLLFGLIDELPGTPGFFASPEAPDP